MSLMLGSQTESATVSPGGFNNTAVRVVATSGAASVTPGDVVITVDTGAIVRLASVWTQITDGSIF